MDVFIEQIVARKKDIKDMLIYTAIAAVNALVIYLSFSISILKYIVLLIILGLAYGDYFLAITRNIEFEYMVTNGDLDIDTIISKKKRKRILSVSVKDFEVIASLKSDKLTSDIQQIKNVIHTESSPSADGLYFGVVNYKGARTVVVMEPSEKVLNALRSAAPRKVFID